VDNCVIMEAPTNLGLHPGGVEKLSGALLHAGFGNTLRAPVINRWSRRHTIPCVIQKPSFSTRRQLLPTLANLLNPWVWHWKPESFQSFWGRLRQRSRDYSDDSSYKAANRGGFMSFDWLRSRREDRPTRPRHRNRSCGSFGARYPTVRGIPAAHLQAMWSTDKALTRFGVACFEGQDSLSAAV
jgi:hypothetical protein